MTTSGLLLLLLLLLLAFLLLSGAAEGFVVGGAGAGAMSFRSFGGEYCMRPSRGGASASASAAADANAGAGAGPEALAGSLPCVVTVQYCGG
jgi:hypothetical protein